MRRTWWTSLAVLCFAIAPACGDSSGDGGGNGEDPGTGGTAGSAGNAGNETGGSTTGGNTTGGSAGSGTSGEGGTVGGSAGSGGDGMPGGEGGEAGATGGSSGLGGTAGVSGAGSSGGGAGGAGAGGAGGKGGAGAGGKGGAGAGGKGGAGAGGKGGSGGAGGSGPVSVTQASVGDLVVSEIMRDPSVVDDSVGEWFEVYNAAARAYDLSGLALTDNAATVSVTQSVVIQPGGYVVFARAATGNGGVTPGFVYGNALQLGNAADFVRLGVGNTVLDEVSYDAGATFPARPGSSMSFRLAPPNATTNNVGGNWCAAATTFGSGDRGTPGAANGACLYGSTALAAGDLVITEIMANPNAVDDTVGEWFEVKNTSADTFDLAGLTVRDLGTDTFTVPVSTQLLVAGGARVVFGASAAMPGNGGLTVNYAYDRNAFALGQNGDEIVLATTIVIDQVAYTNAWPLVVGASLSLRPTSETATANDLVANWCAATSTYGAGDRGTPGAANNTCP